MNARTDMWPRSSHLGPVLVAALICLLPWRTVQASGIDSLRVVIRSLQNDIEQTQMVVRRLSDRFNGINHKIYEYKAGGAAGNIFSRNRMQNALKTSHLLADSLDALNKRLRQKNRNLLQAYSAAILQIDLQVHNDLDFMKRNPQVQAGRKKRLAQIKRLEAEKTEYATRLQTLEVDQQDWKKIMMEADDTLRRLRRKAALLDDFLRNAQHVLGYIDSDILKDESDRKTYAELLDFYREMGESLDDDQDIFDRTRLEELADKIENLDNEAEKLRAKRRAVAADIIEIKAKIERFRRVIDEQNEK